MHLNMLVLLPVVQCVSWSAALSSCAGWEDTAELENAGSLHTCLNRLIPWSNETI